MAEPLILRVRKALAGIINPATSRNIIAEGAVQGLAADEDGRIRFALDLPRASRADSESLLADAKAALVDLEGVTSVTAVATAHGAPQKPASGGHNNPIGLKNKPRIEEAGETLQDVKCVIAIASGKGGVGKSTVAANLAIALARAGFKTGLMDADIYGPSLPTLFGLTEKAKTHEGKIIPMEAHGVSAMSIGLLVDEDQALAWRGPMVMGAIRQLISDVDWGPLDILLIDTPPGTGDAHLSLIQSKLLSGAIIVSTPQELALADVRRGVSLFRKTETPIIGVIENMAWLENANGERQFLFGEGGAKRAAQELNAPFLGAIPLFPELRQASDDGQPLAINDHPASDCFKLIAEQIAATIRQA